MGRHYTLVESWRGAGKVLRPERRVLAVWRAWAGDQQNVTFIVKRLRRPRSRGLGSWTMPRGSQLFAVGSKGTCTLAGLFVYMTVFSTPLYNCSLATYYFLQLRLNWVNRRIKAVERWLHILPWTECKM